jgi:hypothetical protein
MKTQKKLSFFDKRAAHVLYEVLMTQTSSVAAPVQSMICLDLLPKLHKFLSAVFFIGRMS